MPRRAPPMERSWVALSSYRGTHLKPSEAGPERVLCSASIELHCCTLGEAKDIAGVYHNSSKVFGHC